MLTPKRPQGINLTSLAIFLLLGLPSTVAAQSVGVSVPGAAKWIDTKVDVVEGDLLTITATGLWTEGGNTNGPDGVEKPWPDNFFNFADLGVCMYCAQTATPFWGALIGYIGFSPPAAGSYTSKAVFREATKVFYVGANYEAEAPASGRLWLNKNTDSYSNYTVDNGGQVEAIITDSLPETETQSHQRAQAAANSLHALEPLQKATNFCVRGTLDHIGNAIVEEALSLGLQKVLPPEKLYPFEATVGPTVLSSAFLGATIYQDNENRTKVRIDYEDSNGQVGNKLWDAFDIVFAGFDSGLGIAADNWGGKHWYESKEGLLLKTFSAVGTRSIFDCAMAGLWASGELGRETGQLLRESSGELGRQLRDQFVLPNADISGDWTLVRSTPLTCINFTKGCLTTPIHIRVNSCTATECAISRSDGDWKSDHTITRTVTSSGPIPIWLAEFDDIAISCTDKQNVDHLNVARIGLRFSVTTAEAGFTFSPKAKSVGGFYTVHAASNPPDCASNASSVWLLYGSR